MGKSRAEKIFCFTTLCQIKNNLIKRKTKIIEGVLN